MKLSRALGELVTRLDAYGIAYAVVGGLAASAHLPRDLGDLQAMLRENPTLDERRVAALLETITLRGYSRGQDLPEKWQKLRAELGE